VIVFVSVGVAEGVLEKVGEIVKVGERVWVAVKAGVLLLVNVDVKEGV
jgi:hypothetical protein